MIMSDSFRVDLSIRDLYSTHLSLQETAAMSEQHTKTEGSVACTHGMSSTASLCLADAPTPQASLLCLRSNDRTVVSAARVARVAGPLSSAEGRAHCRCSVRVWGGG